MKLMTFQPRGREPLPPGGVLISEWQVGRRTCRLVQDVTAAMHGSVGTLRCDWAPDRPRTLSKAEWREYRAGRDAHHQHVANIIGGNVLCAEL